MIYKIKNVWRTRIALHKNSLHNNSLRKSTKLITTNTRLLTTTNKLITKNTKLITTNNKLITKNTKLIIIFKIHFLLFAGPLGHEACEISELRNLVNYLLGSNSTCTILNEVVDF